MAKENKKNLNSKLVDVFFVGNDLSIYESLKKLSLKIDSYIIDKYNYSKNIIYNKQLFLIDDSIENFKEKILFLKKKKFNNFFILMSNKKLIPLESIEYKVFFKPLKIFELHKEVSKKIAKNILQSEIWKLDRSKLKFYKDEKCYIKLTEKEFYFIFFLLQNKGRSVTKENILNKVWKFNINKNYNLVDIRVVETLVSRIRKKLKKIKSGPKLIKDKTGYKLLV